MIPILVYPSHAILATEIYILAERIVEPRHLPTFVELVKQEFQRLNEFNIARCRLRLSEYWAWYRARSHG
jgi:hypothetical protein